MGVTDRLWVVGSEVRPPLDYPGGPWEAYLPGPGVRVLGR